jgi:hypothetical protein
MMRAALVLLLGSCLAAGCATPAQKQAKTEPAKQDDDEYVYYTPIGSYIPVKVRKADLKMSDADADKARDIFADLQRKGQRAPRE